MKVSEGIKSSYDGYIEALEAVERENPKAVVLESMKPSDPSSAFKSERHLHVGLAEQDMVLVASGLALGGKTVFVAAPLSPVFAGRSYEQIRAAVAIPNLRVVLSSVQDGLILDQAGAVRQMNEDLALMRVLPNMSVVVPADRNSARELTLALAKHDGPSYLRVSYADVEDIYEEGDSDFHIGGARLLTEGDGVTICACGIMVKEALKASSILAQQGISAEILDCYSIKPFPEQMLLASVRRTGCCVVAEKHSSMAGLYGAVAECLCRNYSVPARSVATRDHFGQSGAPEELREYYGLTYREIVHNVIQVWAMRRR